jgi:hypothetical protein
LDLCAPWGKSDHSTLHLIVTPVVPKPPVKYRRFLGGLKTPEVLTNAAAMSWAPGEYDIEILWKIVKSNLLTLLDKFAPIRRVRTRGRPPWCKAKVVRAYKQKSKMWNEYLRAPGHRR